MRQEGQYILVIRPTEDRRARYVTAKKLAQMFRAVPFSDWKERLDSGGATVVMRSDMMSSLTAYKQSIGLCGVEVEVVDQKTIGGAKVF